MDGLVNKIQQRISPNRSKVYIISLSTHSGLNAQGKLFCMQISRADVADLIYFMAIARHRSFSRAAIELGVSASALSHALKGLETRLGVRLLNRTTKSVTPTAAGEELVQSVLQPFDTIEGALESLNRYRNTPTGRIRINAAVEAANLLLAPVMPAFMDRYPDIEIDIVASTVWLTSLMRASMPASAMVAPSRRIWLPGVYPPIFAGLSRPPPTTWNATERLNIRMIYYTIAASAIVSATIRVYRWELKRDGETYQMTVPGSVTVNHAETGLVAVLGGAGLMYFPEPLVAPYVKDGRLRLVLTEWSPLEEGFHIYYSSRRQLPTGLRLLIEFIQEARPLGL
ncbi:transcriptional regulator [Klebsiella quasipneumoniae]|nr:transcriptional regulator [Klebsiella quasipneumoniae]